MEHNWPGIWFKIMLDWYSITFVCNKTAWSYYFQKVTINSTNFDWNQWNSEGWKLAHGRNGCNTFGAVFHYKHLRWWWRQGFKSVRTEVLSERETPISSLSFYNPAFLQQSRTHASKVQHPFLITSITKTTQITGKITTSGTYFSKQSILFPFFTNTEEP